MSGTPDQAGALSTTQPTEESQHDAVEVPAAPLRVGWVTGPTVVEQYGRALQPLAIGLMDEFIELTAIYPAGADVQELPSPPMETIRHGRVRWLGWHTRTAETLAMELRRRKVQLLHALDAEAWPLTAELGRLAGLHCVVSSRSLDDGPTLRYRHGSIAAVLAGSEVIREKLLARHVVPPERVELVRPGVYQARKASCFPDPELRVSIIAGGPINRFATFEAVIQSFAELKRRGHECVFFLMGNGRAEQRLRRLAETLEMRSEMTFVDRQPPRLLPDIFKAADVYVSPLPSSRIDMPCLLAMAAGIPVVTAGAGASDFLIDGQTALRFTEGNAADLTAKMSTLLDAPAQATALADRALAHLRAYHSPAGAVAAVTEVYRRVAGQPNPSPALQTP